MKRLLTMTTAVIFADLLASPVLASNNGNGGDNGNGGCSQCGGNNGSDRADDGSGPNTGGNGTGEPPEGGTGGQGGSGGGGSDPNDNNGPSGGSGERSVKVGCGEGFERIKVHPRNYYTCRWIGVLSSTDEDQAYPCTLHN